jgi:hypothetical protein
MLNSVSEQGEIDYMESYWWVGPPTGLQMTEGSNCLKQLLLKALPTYVSSKGEHYSNKMFSFLSYFITVVIVYHLVFGLANSHPNLQCMMYQYALLISSQN